MIKKLVPLNIFSFPDSSNSRKRKLSEEPLESYKKPAFQEAPPIAGAKETDTITPTISKNLIV